jgi:putative ABC transport system ATP-binding protein
MMVQHPAGGGVSALPANKQNRGFSPILVHTHELVREYPSGEGVLRALNSVSIEIPERRVVCIKGRSGSGKTTLLNLIGGLDRPTSGGIWLDGDWITDLDESEVVKIRRDKIGFVFQTFGLIPILTATENVEVPLRLATTPVDQRARRVEEVLDMVGLGERARHRPHELSGGEQQRVAIARALANHPKLLIADEPTGQLDLRTGRTIMQLIHRLVRDTGLSALVATHDPTLLDLADRVIELRDGALVGDTD